MTSQPSHTSILDDLPASLDALDFQPYIDTLADVIASPNTSTPLTIGVFGTWGSGKTSLMRLVQKGLPGSFRTAWFDAWKFEKEETLWRALLLSVLATLRGAIPKNNKTSHRELDDLETSLYQAVEREEVGNLQIDWGKAAGGLAEGAFQIGLSFLPGVSALAKLVEELQKKGGTGAASKLLEAIHREHSKIRIEQVQFLEQFQKRFQDLTQKHVVEKKLRLVVFIDDLDRCLPEKAVEVLEAIKLFVDVPGCVFVLGLDQEVIARGIEIKYRELGLDTRSEDDRQRFVIDGTRYLEKIIQLPFQLPDIGRTEMASFVEGLVADWPHNECARVFAEGLGANPRQVKRTVNVFLLLSGLAKRREQDVHPVRLAKIVAIQNAFPRLYDFLKEDRHRLLRELEAYYLAQLSVSDEGRAAKGREGGSILGGVTDEETRVQTLEPPAAIRRVLTLHPTQPDFNFSPLTPDEIRIYFTLTRRAEAPQVQTAGTAAPAELPRAAFEPQMVPIPSGQFLMGTSDEQAKKLLAAGFDADRMKWEQPQHTVELSEYQIGKYPISNLEYQFFVREASHSPPRHWDGDQYPEGKGDHPVVYVSWGDATAYCKWLAEKTGKPYRLPTEAEWEKAASWEEGGGVVGVWGSGGVGEWGGRKRVYPWGDEWGAGKCNSEEGGAGGTTPVGQYSPAGDSPYGCADMAGNVWEWCADWFDEKEYEKRKGQTVKDPQGSEKGDLRALRGGSFYSSRGFVRCAVRSWNNPDVRNHNGGFRVGASSPSPHSGL